MRISDVIEQFIKDMLNEKEEVEIQRNELAHKFNCVPSQINYVISTRFSPIHGYYVESRRGGGGSIIIKRLLWDEDDIFLKYVERIGDSITQLDSERIISDLLTKGFIDKEQACLLKVATNDNILKLDNSIKDGVRARLFKNMLINMDWSDKYEM